MKKKLLSLLAMTCIAVASLLISCTPTPTSYEPVRTDEPGFHSTYDSSRYRLNEIIVIFKSAPNKADVNKIKAKIHASGIDSAAVKTDKKCNCNEYVQVWEADSLHSRIHAEGIRAGSVSDKGSKGVGEDGLAYYSLNFKQNIPVDSLPNFADFPYDPLKKVENDTIGKEVVRIAVLDTGIDTEKIISTGYRWTNQREASIKAKSDVDDDHNCYNDDAYGWNFIGNNNNVMDDNEGRHGTLVSHYIINEFVASRNKAVKLMTLKTHDKDGSGDLFSSICAIYYAMERRANIINASWGFYYYQGEPHPFLDSLITEVLRAKGILFVAAAGNKIQEIDDFARQAYSAAHPGVTIPDSYLRNLDYHNFYPACLSKKDSNNVITVTTADKTRVSPTQNYSSNYVDMGAIPDDITLMRFKVPFEGPAASISGSSFATPIVAGRIGAFLPNSYYTVDIDKRVVFDEMERASLSTRSSLLESEHIRLGRIAPHD